MNGELAFILRTTHSSHLASTPPPSVDVDYANKPTIQKDNISPLVTKMDIWQTQ